MSWNCNISQFNKDSITIQQVVKLIYIFIIVCFVCSFLLFSIIFSTYFVRYIGRHFNFWWYCIELLFVIQLLSCVHLAVTPWIATRQDSLSITISQSFLKPMSIESVMPSNHLILCRPLLLLPSIFPSTRVFSNESAPHIRGPTYWSFNFNISPSKEYSGLISFRIDWFDFLAVHGTLKSLLQHHSSKVSILQSSAFFMTQLLHPLFYIEYSLLNLHSQLFITSI